MRSKNAVVANLIFSNVQRTVANLTAKNPSAEVVSLDGAYQMGPDGQPLVDERGEPMWSQDDFEPR
jgi:S1-C subfamily serine protease